MNSEIKSKVAQWKSATFDSNTKQKIEKLEIEDPKQLEESFYKNLEFGTGGMRGVMGCLLYTSPSPRDVEESRMPSSA